MEIMKSFISKLFIISKKTRRLRFYSDEFSPFVDDSRAGYFVACRHDRFVVADLAFLLFGDDDRWEQRRLIFVFGFNRFLRLTGHALRRQDAIFERVHVAFPALPDSSVIVRIVVFGVIESGGSFRVDLRLRF